MSTDSQQPAPISDADLALLRDMNLPSLDGVAPRTGRLVAGALARLTAAEAEVARRRAMDEKNIQDWTDAWEQGDRYRIHTREQIDSLQRDLAAAEADVARLTRERDDQEIARRAAEGMAERSIRELDEARAERDLARSCDGYAAFDKVRVERDRLAASLETECDIRADKTWSGQFYCACHSVWFRSDEREPAGCPVAEFARAALASLDGG